MARDTSGKGELAGSRLVIGRGVVGAESGQWIDRSRSGGNLCSALNMKRASQRGYRHP